MGGALCHGRTLNRHRVARRQQADRRREALLDVALALVSERGFGATTIADISRAAGTAHGLVYHYFRSKDELLSAVFDRYSFLPALRALLAVAPNRRATDVLPEIATGFSATLTKRGDFLSLVVREAQTNPRVAAALGAVMAEGLKLLGAYLKGRVAAGEMRPHDVTVTARAIFQVIVASHLRGPPPAGFATGLVDIVLRGVLVTDVDGPMTRRQSAVLIR